MKRIYHDLSNHPLYHKWQSIKQRCYNKNSTGWRIYGARGVTICSEWKTDFEAFFNWCIKNGYSHEKVIDKDILSKKLGISPAIYSPDTCMFITQKENNGAILQNSELHRQNSKELWKSGRMRYIGIDVELISELCECYYNSKISMRKLNRLTGVCRATLSKYINEAK